MAIFAQVLTMFPDQIPISPAWCSNKRVKRLDNLADITGRRSWLGGHHSVGIVRALYHMLLALLELYDV